MLIHLLRILNLSGDICVLEASLIKHTKRCAKSCFQNKMMPSLEWWVYNNSKVNTNADYSEDSKIC